LLPEDAAEWHIEVDPASAGTRLDQYLAQALDDLSRSRIKALILAGDVEIDGETVSEPKHKVKPGATIALTLPPPEDAEPAPEDIPLTILFEDEDLIVIDKPVGMVVHPAPGSPDGTLVNALIHHCGQSLKGIGGVRRPGIVHRLDKDTSGVMVAAKTETAHNHLAAQFADHGRTGPLSRTYTAFVWGHPARATGTIDAPLGRDPHNRLKQAVRRDGRAATTHFRVTARHGDDGWQVARLACNLETGRTHQIRVHMSHAGTPIMADPLYASGFATKANRLPDPLRDIVSALGRQALHASELAFAHPRTEERMAFETALPPDLAALADGLSRFTTT